MSIMYFQRHKRPSQRPHRRRLPFGRRRSRAAKGCSAPCRNSWFCGGCPKRVFDILAAIAFLPAVLPLILVFGLLVMRDGGAPFYGHTRIGRGGRAFKCWKLRSMVTDSKAHLRQHLAEHPTAQAEWSAHYKLAEDPRITPIGQILRSTSLDELPQIWNVLRGDMSFIGPRPITRSELRFYGSETKHYLAMRPGITGLWQVSGRNLLNYDQRIMLDIEYARNCGLAQDARILLRTLPVLLSRTGR